MYDLERFPCTHSLNCFCIVFGAICYAGLDPNRDSAHGACAVRHLVAPGLFHFCPQHNPLKLALGICFEGSWMHVGAYGCIRMHKDVC